MASALVLFLYIMIIPIRGWIKPSIKNSLLERNYNRARLYKVQAANTPSNEVKSVLSFTKDNIELVLDKVRPYLESDGGNVELVDIEEGGLVKLRLQGACRSCPSSVNTMKFGLEKTLKESIPDITEVINVDSEINQDSKVATKKLSILGVDAILNQVRPFIAAAGGKVKIVHLANGEEAVGQLPTITLQLEGACSKFKSVKNEIESRIHNYFRTTSSTLVINWEDND